ncbi:MAG: hypothetical protein J5I94_15625, partial [Phaeodactylibacter sp.]|nr:hypothetical protein [Phaeodactylibacter sp.]
MERIRPDPEPGPAKPIAADRRLAEEGAGRTVMWASAVSWKPAGLRGENIAKCSGFAIGQLFYPESQESHQVRAQWDTSEATDACLPARRPSRQGMKWNKLRPDKTTPPPLHTPSENTHTTPPSS